MSPRPEPPEVDRVAASRAAVAARRARAAVKHAVASRTRSARGVLDTAWTEPDSPEAGLRVRELLTSVPTLGPTRTAKVMRELAIAESKKAGGLGIRQRAELWNYLAGREQGAARSRLLVLAGPTAVGKGTVSAYIREHHPEIQLSVSATTRPPRPGEIDGVHYRFLSDAEFDRMIAANEFLEWAVVHNSYRYGTPRPPIDAALAAGKRVMLEIDLQGARRVREQMSDAILVFLLPPSWEELVRRLTGRGTEDTAEQARRLETARVELAAQDEFDYRVVNTDVAQAAQEVVELVEVPNSRSGTTTFTSPLSRSTNRG
jgi:guanylate kinase